MEQPTLQEEEIDLRKYVQLLFRNWYWIVGLALAAAVFGFSCDSLLPPEYEAKAQVFASGSAYQISFDPRFKSLEDF